MMKDLNQKGKKQNHWKNGKKRNSRIFYDEDYIKRAEEMERALWADGEPDQDEDEPDEEAEARSYAALIRRLKEEGVYQEEERETETEETSAPSDSRIRRLPRKRSVSVGRVAGVALLCCACVFAASMTSEANRNYFVKGMRYLVGDDSRIIAGNDGENEDVNLSEQDAIKEIETKLNVEIPEFYYRPSEFEFLGYDISKSTEIARIEYKYCDNIVSFVVDKQNDKSTSRTLSADGKKDSFVVENPDGITISVEKFEEKYDSQASYTAIWKQENVIYWLSGKIEKEEIIKILEQMVY